MAKEALCEIEGSEERRTRETFRSRADAEREVTRNEGVRLSLDSELSHSDPVPCTNVEDETKLAGLEVGGLGCEGFGEYTEEGRAEISAVSKRFPS
jgi:hypothetical protein